MIEEKLYWYWLCNIKNIGYKKIEFLLEYYKTPKNIFYGRIDFFLDKGKLSKEDISNIEKSKDIKRVEEEYKKLKEKKISFVTREDEEYPKRLLHIFNPPHALYVRGSLPKEEENIIGVVGARNCSDYGRDMAIYLSGELSKMGVSIISGLALGVDGYAHKGALEAGGKTYGVLGCGVDICYPRENFDSYMKIPEHGGVISEYGMGIEPIPWHFPMRNRIISGLSSGILVIEAKEKSGSLITADMGLEQGKNIYALPGRVYDTLSTGCNNLIKMGAKLVTSPKDILEDFSINYENLLKSNKKNNKLLETNEKMVYASLDFRGKHVNEIVSITGLAVQKTMEVLITLELKGYIKQIRQNYYAYRKD